MSERRDATVHAVPATASGEMAMPIAVLLTSNFDVKWFQISLEHERAALDARDRAIAAADGSSEMGAAFDDELKAAMVAIAASAFAIDAMYTKLSDMLDPADRPRASDRVGFIVETLKAALELGKRGHAWQSSIPGLFEQRDELVHFRGKPYESRMHPTGKSAVSRENVTYTAEAMTSAVDLAFEVLTTAYQSPRKKHAALVEWSQSAAHVPALLENERAAARGHA
jgi:hypothetical protein